jgi:hypothetical protein
MTEKLTVEMIRTKIADTVLEFLSNNKKHLVLKTFTGSGKTTTTLQTVVKSGHRLIYAAPSHDIIEENIKRSPYYNFDYLHLEGRDRLCKNKDLKELAKQGLDIHSFCETCQYRIDDVCDYEKNIKQAYRDRPNIAITHAHITTWLPTFLNTDVGDHKMSDYYDVLIIDENPFKCFLNELQVTLQDLILFRERCIQTSMDTEIVRIVETLLIPPFNYDRLLNIPLVDLDRKEVMRKWVHRLSELYIQNGVREIPKNILPFLFEIYEQLPKKDIQKMIYYKDGIINFTYFKSNALDLGRIKILGLDGTASSLVWDSMLKTKVDIFPIDYRYKDETVFQLNGGKYPIMSWKYKESSTPASLCRLIDLIASKKKRKVLIVGTNVINHKVASLCKCKNREFALYYSLRSKNEYYKNCDTVILTCQPSPPPEKIQSSVSLSEWSVETWRRIYTQEEMLQAIGRLRQNIEVIKQDGYEPIIREPTMVYIFPSTDVERGERTSLLVPEARVLSKQNLYSSLRDNEFFAESQLYQNELLPLMPISIKRFAELKGMSFYKAKAYFMYLLKDKLIEEASKGVYDITQRGIKKLNVANQHAKGNDSIIFSLE